MISLDHLERAAVAFLRANNNPTGLALLGGAALLEYLFPPFPGDTVTLFGAVLVARYHWSLPWVFLSVLAGSGLGAMVDHGVGVWMRRPYHSGRFPRSEANRARVERVLEAFRRHGAAYVALNRFLPAVRAIFFVASGLAGLNPWLVLFYALVSAALWNALIIGVGYSVGASWTRIKGVFAVYSRVAWGVVALVATGLLARWAWRARAVKRGAGRPPGDR